MIYEETMTKINRFRELPTLPVILKHLFDVLQDENSTFCDIADVIKHDQSITERILRVANSPYFGHAGNVTSLEQAIMFLGYDLVKGICLGTTVFKLLDNGKLKNISNLWKHSYEVAIISASIAEYIVNVDSSLCFVAGLLHDIGRVVFLTIDKDAYLDIITDENLLTKERTLFGADHAISGGEFLRSANLPEEIVIAVTYHHHPTKVSMYKEVASVVALAEGFSRTFFPKFEDDGFWTDELNALLLEFNLEDPKITSIKKKAFSEVVEMESLLSG